MSSVINATTTSGLQIQPDNSGSLQLKTNNGTTAVTIDTSQNVGIGTTSPGYKLDVNGSIGGSSVTVVGNYTANRANATAYNLAGGIKFQVDGTSYAAIAQPSAQALAFYTGNDTTERMRIDSSGNVLVGTTSIASYFDGALNVQGRAHFRQGSAADSTVFAWNQATSGTRSLVEFGVNTSYTNVGTIKSNGSSTSYNTTSDYRLKENITPMTGALDKVLQLKPVTYTWKSTGQSSQGFIAHELQAVVPDCVTGEKDDVDEEGNPIHQGVDTSFLVATLTAAIQEQTQIINDLKARIETLEAK